MGKINVLDKTVAELIAAGEVIERPASIVKELLENAIDAGSTAVTVEIRQGGISYIRVTDNGGGILPEDIPLAFLRHATSKLRLSDDLNFIATLGFRGEALASIAAVSRLELTSRPAGSPYGTCIRLEGGEQRDLSEAGCPEGTTVLVRDLFYNVPARLKFLRRDQSEANAVAGLVDKLALSHPEISFKLISDQKVRLHTPGDGRPLSAIRAVFGREFANALLPVEYKYQQVGVRGYTSSTQYSRQNRSMQHFFVNGRFVRSKTCGAALEEGYKNALMTGKYPFCVLNVQIPFEQVDVNVHPAKTEVRFLSDRAVFDGVYFAVKSALSRDDILSGMQTTGGGTDSEPLSPFHSQEADQLAVSAPAETDPVSAIPASRETPESKGSVLPVGGLTLRDSAKELSVSGRGKPSFTADGGEEPPQKEQQEQPSLSEESYEFLTPEMLRPAPSAAEPPAGPGPAEDEPSDQMPLEPPDFSEEPGISEPPSFRLLGETFHTYAVFEAGDTLYLLDKHAAHERILFEKLKKSVTTEERQLLLKPVLVHVSPEECQVLSEHEDSLKRMGFSYEEFGANSFLLREVPLVLAEYDVAAVFLDTVQKLASYKRDISSDVFENLLHSMACRSAVKANDRTSPEELAGLLRQVYADGEIRHCPHGRPVAVAIPRREIEKRFGRVT